MRRYSTLAVTPATKTISYFVSLLPLVLFHPLERKHAGEHFSPVAPFLCLLVGLIYSLASRKLLNTKSLLDSFGPFDFVTKPKKVSHRVGWSSKAEFESDILPGDNIHFRKTSQAPSPQTPGLFSSHRSSCYFRADWTLRTTLSFRSLRWSLGLSSV